MEAKLRHQQIILFYSGGATILFALWSLAKRVFTMVINPPPWEQLLTKYNISNLDELALTIPDFSVDTFIREAGNTVMGIILVLNLLFFLYIGIAAMKDAAGKQKRFFYIIFTALALILAVQTSIASFNGYMEGTHVLDNYAFYDERLSAIIIETSSQLSLLIIIIAGCRARWLRHKIAKAKTGE